MKYFEVIFNVWCIMGKTYLPCDSVCRHDIILSIRAQQLVQGTNTFDPMRRRLPSIPVSLWCITCLILHGLTPNKDDTLAFTEIRNRAKHHVRATSRKKVYSHQNFGWAIFRSSDEENVWECSSFGSKTRLSHSCSMKTHIVGHQIEHNSYLRNRRHWKLSLHREIVSFVWIVRCRETTAKVRWWVICTFTLIWQ